LPDSYLPRQREDSRIGVLTHLFPAKWFAVRRRSVYCRPTEVAPKVDAKFAKPIRAMIEENPAFGYRTAWSSPAAATLHWCAAIAYAKSSSHPTRPSRRIGSLT